MSKRTNNFDKMDVAQLVQLRDEIESALNEKIVFERKQLQTKIAALVALGGRRSTVRTNLKNPRPLRRGQSAAKRKAHPLKGRKAEPKYRGPDGETWAGRGLAPRWLTALEKKGKKRESFLIAT